MNSLLVDMAKHYGSSWNSISLQQKRRWLLLLWTFYKQHTASATWTLKILAPQMLKKQWQSKMLLKPCYVGKRDNHSCLCAYICRHAHTHILGWQTKHSHKDSFHHLLSKMFVVGQKICEHFHDSFKANKYPGWFQCESCVL